MHGPQRGALSPCIAFGVWLNLIAASASGQAREEIYFEVLTPGGDAVEGLTPGNFSILNNGTRLRIVSAELQDTPMTVALLVDNGDWFSRDGSVNALRDGMIAFLDALPPQHEVGLYTIGGNPRQRVGFTRDRDRLRETASKVFPERGAGTALLDSIRDTLERRLEDDATFPVFVMMLSDNFESSGHYSDNQYEALINDLRRRGVTIHIVFLISQSGGPITRYARNLADNTGGFYHGLALPTGLALAMTELATRMGRHFDAVSKRYRVVYEIPPQAGPEISVNVQAPGAQIQVFPDRLMPR